MTGGVVGRNLRVDFLKLLCAQCIVLHHFSVYGPVGDALAAAAPAVSAWLYDYGRMAVQVFLVLGGYLAVGSLERMRATGSQTLVAVVWKRYLRLVLPLLAALLLVSLVAALTRLGLQDDFIPDAPSLSQVLSHVLLLQDVQGIEALSVGVWYVAIDFQLYVLMAFLVWGGQALAAVPHATRVLVGALMLLSLFHANRNPDWDAWAVYFFGAYGMGAVARWAQRSPHRALMLAGLVAVVALALVMEFRERLVLALVTALVLGTMPRTARVWPAGLQRWVALLGQSSYALFLVHFSVLMLVNLVFAQWSPAGPWATGLALLAGVALSTGLAVVFARRVETPLSRWADR